MTTTLQDLERDVLKLLNEQGEIVTMVNEVKERVKEAQQLIVAMYPGLPEKWLIAHPEIKQHAERIIDAAKVVKL